MSEWKTMENLEMDHKKSRSDSQLSHSPSIQALSHYIQVLSSLCKENDLTIKYY